MDLPGAYRPLDLQIFGTGEGQGQNISQVWQIWSLPGLSQDRGVPRDKVILTQRIIWITLWVILICKVLMFTWTILFTWMIFKCLPGWSQETCLPVWSWEMLTCMILKDVFPCMILRDVYLDDLERCVSLDDIRKELYLNRNKMTSRQMFTWMILVVFIWMILKEMLLGLSLKKLTSTESSWLRHLKVLVHLENPERGAY